MAKKLIKNPTPQGVGAGQTASVELSRGYTHETIFTRMNVDVAGVATDVAAADWKNYIDDIRLKVNGKAEITVTADFLVKRLGYKSKTIVPGALPLFLADPDDDSPADRIVGAYGTLGIQSFTMELDIKAGVTVNSLDIYSLVSKNTPYTTHRTIRRGSVNVGGAGTVDISDIRRGVYNLEAIHFETANIGNVEVLVNQRTMYEADRVVSDALQKGNGLVPDPTMTHVDFLTSKRAIDMIGMNVQDFRVRADFSAAGNYTYYVEANEGGIAIAANSPGAPRRKNRLIA